MNPEDIEMQTLFLNSPLSKIPKLFPIRRLNTSLIERQFTIDKITHLLKCQLCTYTLINPVLLPCSHRFCKRCLSDFIRDKQKKNCPSCSGQLLRKRQLRYDFQLLSVIKSISQQQELHTSQSIDRKKDAWIFLQQQQLGAQPRKKVKDSHQINKKNFTKSYHHYLERKQINQELYELNNKAVSQIHQKKEIKSSYPMEQQTFYNKRRQVENKAVVNSHQSTVINICQDQNQPQIVQYNEQYQINLQQLTYTQNLLIQQFGKMYLSNLLSTNSSCFSIIISLNSIDNQLRYPKLQQKLYTVSLNVCVKDIKNIIINQQFNLENETVQLYLTTDPVQTEIYLYDHVTILDIIKEKWKSFDQCKYFSFSDISRQLKNGQVKKDAPKLYYYLSHINLGE